MSGNIWDAVLGRIETKVNKHTSLTWFRPTSLLADDGLVLRVRVPNAGHLDWLTKHYTALVDEALMDVGRGGTAVKYVSGALQVDGPSPRAESATDLPQPGGEPDSPGGLNGDGNEDAGLNLRYTFDSFIVGGSNQFAHAACRAVAEVPARSYNPLFIYGGVGLGKTHLMHAIGHYVLKHMPAYKVTYIRAERFMNEMVNALRFDRILEFRERYRSVDVLLIDDVQFLSRKESTQTEFFHTD